MKNYTMLCVVLLCTMLFIFPSNTYSQVLDTDNDTIKDYFDVDDDNDGILDISECPIISGAATPKSDAITWSKNGFDVFTIANNTNGKGYQESGFQKEVLGRGQPLTVLNGNNDYVFPASSSVPGSGATSVGTFANGTMDFEDNYAYRSYNIDQFRATTAGGFTSGGGPSHGVYVYPEVGNQTGDYYTVNINFTNPVSSFSFDFVDAFDTTADTAIVNYEVYADGNLIAYFSDAYVGNDAIGNIDLFDVDGVLKGNVAVGQNIENTIGFATSDPVSVVSIRHIVISGGLAAGTHDPHGLDTFAYSFPCQPQLDIDNDDDGIPDNIEAQPTNTYIAPSGTVNLSGSFIGLWDNYGTGITPENTDGTDEPDYLDLDSDNDGLLDIEENGMANSVLNSDLDNDGLDNAFEGSNLNDAYDVNDEIDDPTNLSILPDTDGDLTIGGDLDYRDNLDTYIENATIDFDGVDDYLDTAPYIKNWTGGTIMSWIKINHSSEGTLPNFYSIAGQENMRLYVTNARTPAFYVITQDQVTSGSNFPSNNIQVQPDPLLNIKLQNHLWYHVAGVFNSVDQTVKLYLNGELIGTKSDAKLDSELLTKNFNGSPHIYSTREFTVGRYPTNTSAAGSGHFNGDIDEVRVFDSALTHEQIQQTVYQEIENNSGVLRGTIIPKDIQDLSTSAKVTWSSLKGYYPMTNILSSKTSDFSENNNDLELHNITTIQEQTAPMPYQTTADGDWSTVGTWLHGDVWDITDEVNNKDWSIVSVKNNVDTAVNHTTLGLLVDANKELEIANNELKNTWYLELNGFIDLENDSQLIQTNDSELVVGTNGRIERDQQGTENLYTYNYFSSPVHSSDTNSVVDGNEIYTIGNVMMDGTDPTNPLAIDFIGGYNGDNSTSSIKIANYWLWKYGNLATDYYNWQHVSDNGSLKVGEGYSMKGPGLGAVTNEQNYTFSGKPNNGTILLPITTGNTYLVGNPYASAIDAHEFINDNPNLTGKLYFWEHFAGGTHNTVGYQGGYGVRNLSGGAPAIQHNYTTGGTDASGGTGIKTPRRYIPVGQGFFVEGLSSGDIKFDNDQRIFVKEIGNANSWFFKNNTTSVTNTEDNAVEDLRPKFRFGYKSPETYKRQILLTIDENTSIDYNWGYDAKIDEVNIEDMYWNFANEKFVIQGTNETLPTTALPLTVKTENGGIIEIGIDALENVDPSLDIYLKDNDTYHNLRTLAYTVTVEAGVIANRFEIVFTPGETLNTEDFDTKENTTIFYNNTQESLFVKGLKDNVKQLVLYNTLGQNVFNKQDLSTQTLANGISISNLSTGLYIVSIKTENNTTIDKKIIIE